MNDFDARVVREYVVSKATFIIDNNQLLYWQVREAAIDSVQDERQTGRAWNRDDFLMMLDGRGPLRREEVTEVVGSAVCDTISDWLALNDPLHVMLADLLDLTDRDQRRMFGEHYMPEEGDVPADE